MKQSYLPAKLRREILANEGFVARVGRAKVAEMGDVRLAQCFLANPLNLNDQVVAQFKAIQDGPIKQFLGDRVLGVTS